jgi:hypothetical protein
MITRFVSHITNYCSNQKLRQMFEHFLFEFKKNFRTGKFRFGFFFSSNKKRSKICICRNFLFEVKFRKMFELFLFEQKKNFGLSDRSDNPKSVRSKSLILTKTKKNKMNKYLGSAQISTTFYMKCLCILDTLTIVSKFVYEVIVVRNGLREHPLVITSFLCKFLSFSECLCAVSAIYLLIAMSIDKLICVLAPLKVSQILTTNKARIIFSCILFISGIMASYNLFDKRVFKLDSDFDETSSSSDKVNSHGNNHMAKFSNSIDWYYFIISNLTFYIRWFKTQRDKLE